MRNGEPLLEGIALKLSDGETLVAFLKSLNEDYDYASARENCLYGLRWDSSAAERRKRLMFSIAARLM